jgi:hypothetical protein
MCYVVLCRWTTPPHCIGLKWAYPPPLSIRARRGQKRANGSPRRPRYERSHYLADHGFATSDFTSCAYLVRCNTELYHVHGCIAAADACERPIAPDLAGTCDALRAVQGQQGLGGSEQDGWVVSTDLLIAFYLALVLMVFFCFFTEGSSH